MILGSINISFKRKDQQGGKAIIRKTRVIAVNKYNKASEKLVIIKTIKA
jgi:hypothetical protein